VLRLCDLGAVEGTPISPVRTRPKRDDLVKVIAGRDRGRVGKVIEIDHRGPRLNRYRLVGYDDRVLGWFPREVLVICAYRPPKEPRHAAPLPAPDLDAVDALLAQRR
jgi:hypothetical protein